MRVRDSRNPCGRRGPSLSSRDAAPVPARGRVFFCDRYAAGVSEPVRYERRGSAAVLTIDRPERRNAVDGPTADLLERGYERFEADDEARVLILSGAGKVAFCA